jgi:hypothetical protein
LDIDDCLCIAQNYTSIPDDAPEQARTRATYASFGDDGTTATANAYGHLLQITRYFGNKPSGFFCADIPSTPNPSLVEARMDYLQKSCQISTRGIRLLFNDPEDSGKWRVKTATDIMPKMAFLHDRWPSFTTQTSVFDLNIQYMISQGTVYQIYTFTLKEKDSSAVPQIPTLMIDANLLLRNLNFVEDDEENDRGSDDDHYSHCISNDGYLIATMHKVHSTGPEGKDAIALFTSLFINGRLQTFSDAECHDSYGFEKPYEGPEDLYSFGKSYEGSKYYQANLDQQAQVDLIKQGYLRVTVAYKLDIISSDTVKNIPSADFCRAFSYVELILKTPFERTLLSEDEHLDFALRRNLEHILSVCSIPVQKATSFLDQSDLSYCEAIALTCGDVSGHRIATAASL